MVVLCCCRYIAKLWLICISTSTPLLFLPPWNETFSHILASLTTGPFGGSCQIHGPISMESEEVTMSMSTLDVDPPPPTTQPDRVKSPIIKNPGYSHLHCPTELHRSCFCVRFIAEHTRMLEDSVKVKEDWKYVAMVLDRLFLWIFTLAVLVGTAGIILQAPTLYDDRIPIDKKFSDYASSTVVRWEAPAIKVYNQFSLTTFIASWRVEINFLTRFYLSLGVHNNNLS